MWVHFLLRYRVKGIQQHAEAAACSCKLTGELLESFVKDKYSSDEREWHFKWIWDQKSGLEDELTTYRLLPYPGKDADSSYGYKMASSIPLPSPDNSEATTNFTITSRQQKSWAGAQVPGTASTPFSDLLQISSAPVKRVPLGRLVTVDVILEQAHLPVLLLLKEAEFVLWSLRNTSQ